MKTIMIATVTALLAGSAMCQVAESRAVPPLEPQKTRSSWFQSKGFLSDEQSEFRTGARETLKELSREITTLSEKVGPTPPVYFQTRLQSLKQQQLHLTAKLEELNGDAIKAKQSGPRYAFDRCVGSLEEAIDQADQEAALLTKVVSPEKKEAK
jgi:hypothetical protein